MGVNATTFVPAYVSGEILTAADLTVTNSGIPVFATTVTRDAAFGGTGEKVLAEGQACYIEGTGLQVYNGTTWRPYGYRQTYTPTFTNFTLGNGTINYATYTQIDDFVSVSIQVTLGSTSVMGTDPTFSLPVTSASQANLSQLGQAIYGDVGTTYYTGFAYSGSGSTTAALGVIPTNATFAGYAGVNATTPFTWTTNDVFNANISYTV